MNGGWQTICKLIPLNSLTAGKIFELLKDHVGGSILRYEVKINGLRCGWDKAMVEHTRIGEWYSKVEITFGQFSRTKP